MTLAEKEKKQAHEDAEAEFQKELEQFESLAQQLEIDKAMEHQVEFESFVADYYTKEIAPDAKSSKSSKSKKSSSRSGSLNEEKKSSGGNTGKSNSNSDEKADIEQQDLEDEEASLEEHKK